MKFDRIVPKVNAHRLTESNFRSDVTLLRWRAWSHFTQKGAAIWWLHAQRHPTRMHQRPPAAR